MHYQPIVIPNVASERFQFATNGIAAEGGTITLAPTSTGTSQSGRIDSDLFIADFFYNGETSQLWFQPIFIPFHMTETGITKWLTWVLHPRM